MRLGLCCIIFALRWALSVSTSDSWTDKLEGGRRIMSISGRGLLAYQDAMIGLCLLDTKEVEMEWR